MYAIGYTTLRTNSPGVLRTVVRPYCFLMRNALLLRRISKDLYFNYTSFLALWPIVARGVAILVSGSTQALGLWSILARALGVCVWCVLVRAI